MSSSFIQHLKENFHTSCHYNHCFIQPFLEISHTDIVRLDIVSQLCQFLLERIAKSILENKTSNDLTQFRVNFSEVYFKEFSVFPIYYALFCYLENLGVHMRAIHYDGSFEVEKSDSCQFKPCHINFKAFFLGQRILLGQLDTLLPISDVLECTKTFLGPSTLKIAPTGKSSLFDRICVREISIFQNKSEMVKKYFDHLIEKLEPTLQKIQEAIYDAKQAGQKEVCIELPLTKNFLFNVEKFTAFERTVLSFFPIFHFMHTYFIEHGILLTKISSDGKFYFQLES